MISEAALSTTARLQTTFGARAGRPVAVGGVLTLATGLPMTAANLAALEAAWRIELDPATRDETRATRTTR